MKKLLLRLENRRRFKQMMKETFVEEINIPMPWWGWVVTGIGLTVIVYAAINY
jgi:hypothetical protein